MEVVTHVIVLGGWLVAVDYVSRFMFETEVVDLSCHRVVVDTLVSQMHVCPMNLFVHIMDFHNFRNAPNEFVLKN